MFIEALEQSVETGTFQEPTFVKPLPATARFRPGDQLRLECRVEGQPEPRVSWSKDLLPVRDAAKVSRVESAVQEREQSFISVFPGERHSGVGPQRCRAK